MSEIIIVNDQFTIPEHLINMIKFYTELSTRNITERDLEAEIQIAHYKVKQLLANAVNKEEAIDQIIALYGIETNFLINTQNESESDEENENENENINID